MRFGRERAAGVRSNRVVGSTDMTREPYVVYWNNSPTPYMVERFNALADRGAFAFEAWFNDPLERGRTWELDESAWRFAYRYMPAVRFAGRALHWPAPLVGRRRPDVLVSLYAEPVFLVGWSLARLRGARTAFWCQVTSDSWVPRKAWKRFVKRLAFSRVDATLGSGPESREFAVRAGTAPDRALCLPHAIDVDHYREGSARARAERDELRNAIGLRGITFVYVGRLWWGKGVGHLLDAFATVQREVAEEVSLLIVGDGPEETDLERRCGELGLRNVVFAGFKQKPELPLYYGLADVFVFPTLGDPYGLVVDEAMASTLPVISTSAAGEIRDRIEDGVNGYVVPPQDSAAMATRMLDLARDAALRARMGRASLDKVEGHTPERWAEAFELIVRGLLARGA